MEPYLERAWLKNIGPIIVKVLKFEERIAGYVMPHLGLARDGPLPQGSALERDIRTGVNGTIVAHEEAKILSWYRLEVEEDSGAPFQVIDHPRVLPRFEFPMLGEHVEGEIISFDRVF